MNIVANDAIQAVEDDTPVLEAMYGVYGTIGLLVAWDVGLFSTLVDEPKSMSKIGASLGLQPRAVDALLTVAAAQGFVEPDGDVWRLTPRARNYLVDSGPFSRRGILEFTRDTLHLCTPENLKQAAISNRPFGYGQGEVFQTHREQVERARVFTRAMHSQSTAPAAAWPRALDLSAYTTMLDVAGGSGAHSIAAVRQWPNLRAVVLDMAPVCDLADEYVAEAGLAGRVSTVAGDMWQDPFPAADVHFYSLVYHDWAPDKCALLTRKSFEQLPAGGRIVVHEPLVNDDRTGPLVPALFSVVMLLWTEGRQYSGAELSELLRDGGFVDVEAKRTFGSWGIVTGRKP